MRLSFSHKLLSESDVRSIQTMEDLGFSCCELFFMDRESLAPDTLSMVDEVSATTNLYLTTHLPYKNINIASIYQYARDSSTELMVNIVDSLSDYVEIVTLHTGYSPPSFGASFEKAMEYNILSLTRICDRAGQYEIMVGVENAMNERHLIGKTVAEMDRLIEGVGRGNLGLTLDIGHANLTGNLEEYLQRKEYIISVHAHDNFGYSDEHLPLGEGKIDWSHVYDSLKDLDCPLTLEHRTLAEGVQSIRYLQGILSDESPYYRLNRIIAAIRAAKDARELLSVDREMVELSERALNEGGTGSLVNHIVSSCREAMACQVSEIVLEDMRRTIGPSKHKFALLATGSFGRAEMSVESDQDTILVFEDGIDDAGRVYYEAFSAELVTGLASAGFPRCRGNMMASNPKWRGTTAELMSKLDNSYERSVIMDARYIFGSRPLASRFLKTLHHRLHTDPMYAQELAISAINAEVGLEGDSLKVEYFADAEDAFNIKKYGFRIFTEAVKALSVKHCITRTNIADRLWKLQDLGVIDRHSYKGYMFAYDQLTRVMMLGYVFNIKRGVVSNEFVQPYLLSRKDIEGLKEALRIVKEMQRLCISEFAIARSML